MKRVTSLTAFIALFFMLLTSAVLYIVPQGRVAYWANWTLWGLSKEQWTAIHINVGILFLIALLLHTSYNWDNIELYLRNKSRQMKVFTKDFNIALLLTLIIVVGTYAGIPPFSTIIAINSQVKEAAAQKYGQPPYGHAELSSLRTFARHIDIEVTAALQALAAAGYTVASDTQSLKEIAIANGVAPQDVYLAMLRTGASTSEAKRMPRKPTQGLGKLTLRALCSKYGLDTEAVIKSLGESNIKARENMSLRQIAQLNSLSPIDVYGRIREFTDSHQTM
ncbi:MAG: DUF4405 domain-containing protein [Desulfuromonadaceae bacterium]|nr:DUF4405 domain-containing protein [Desulfuromonadaceae bacterium]